MRTSDSITQAVIQRRLEGIAEEMASVLRLTSYSPNIKERADFSCAIFDVQGDLVAQAKAIPVHLGSMPQSVQNVLHSSNQLPLSRGDAIIHNSPYRGGTHLPDITMIMPVYLEKDDTSPVFYVGNRAHHSDVGGMTPGSLPGESTELFQEGIIIPPVKLYQQGEINNDLMSLLLENVRTPVERKGDFNAQFASLNKGISRLQDVCKLYERTTFLNTLDTLNSLAEEATRNFIRNMKQQPEQSMHFVDFLDSDGIDSSPVRIECKITIDNIEGTLRADFSGTSMQREGNCNAPVAITYSALYYVIRCLLPDHVPTNSGVFRPLSLYAPEGSVVNSIWPSAVSSANTETSQRIVDVIWGALAQQDENHVIPSASQGTMNNLLIGSAGTSNIPAFSYYETIAGGIGAYSKGDGADALHSAMTNTSNTPIEALELSYPLQVTEYSIRPNSGGSGLYQGGNGVVKAIKVLVPCIVSIQSERRKIAPWGLKDGDPGIPGRNQMILPNGNIEELPSRFTKKVDTNSIIRVQTPGGGGWGKAIK